MPNKDMRNQTMETKAIGSPVQTASSTKTTTAGAKVGLVKTLSKEVPMSSTPPEEQRAELLGSLTTEQQQRTSARVIKKLKLEPVVDKDKKGAKSGNEDIPECETPVKIDDKLLKFPTVKQRMPKALWSTEEKNYFFEALNEYGKDFDAITAYICAKMKKKGMNDCNLKNKTQVSHFYYRTWHKLSKHVQFGQNVKKVVQELYALINYGELRRKLVAVSEKTCARLGELVTHGTLVVRARGRNRRVRTPACTALRKLNHITERWCGALCARPVVCLRARCGAAWARVQAAAHNPRLRLHVPASATLRTLLEQLATRWNAHRPLKTEDSKCDDHKDLDDDQDPDEDDLDLDEHLQLETDRMIVQEGRLHKQAVLHVGPRAHRPVHLPAVVPSEPLSSHKICFSSYLERMSQRGDKLQAKIRTPKRQRKDSTSDKDKDVPLEPKKIKLEEDVKLMNIEESAVDGIELMASYRTSHDDDKEQKSEETAEEETDVAPDKDMSEREIELSEVDDDGNKSESDNESDKERKFSHLKVKFRVRAQSRGGSVYAVVVDREQEDVKRDAPISNNIIEDDYRNQCSNQEKKVYQKELQINIENIKSIPEDIKTNQEEVNNIPEDSKVNQEEMKRQESGDIEDNKSDIDAEFAIKQVRKGWSIFDCGELTIGDLYLMLGSRSKLELDYWWAEPTAPLPRHSIDKTKSDKDTCITNDRRPSETELFSPKNAFGTDSNDGLSGDEKKSEQQSSPDYKSSSGTLKVAHKLINRPTPAANTNNGFAQLSDRLKRLLALAGNPLVRAATAGDTASGGDSSVARCVCGHVCAHTRTTQKPVCGERVPEPSSVFRHPTPIAPRPGQVEGREPAACCLEGLPRWRRGRPRLGAGVGRVVVQRLLPLLPKLPPPSKLIPVNIVPDETPPPRILPRPPTTATNDLPFFYVLSESNGQFYFHDGDRRIPISPQGKTDAKDEPKVAIVDNDEEDTKSPLIHEVDAEPAPGAAAGEPSHAALEHSASFLPLESVAMSPSRLLSDGWAVSSDDFSLSSFLGHLDCRPPDLAVDSQLQSLMADSSVDYVAKFANLAAELTGDATAEQSPYHTET